MALYDEEAEQTVLGSLLQNPASFSDISEILIPDDFYFEANRIIYHAIAEEVDRGSRPDMMLIISNLKSKDLLTKAGNRSYIANVASQGSSLSALRFAKAVKEFALRRTILLRMKEIEKSAQDSSKSIEDLLAETENAIFAVTDRHSSYNVAHIKETNEEFYEFIRKVKASKGGITGLATGFNQFDQITTGLKGGQLIVLAARPGVGKTTFALNIANNVAKNSGKAVLVFSLEMTRLELLLRLVCADAFLDAQKIQRGMINEREMKKIVESCQRLYSSELYIDDSADLSSWDFKQRSRRLNNAITSQGKELGLIIVDYLQLMTEKSVRSESRQQEVAGISRSMKLIAKDLNVPVLALSQMNRGIEQRGKDPRPQLADLRESGAIEQDADIVMFLHREEMYNKDIPDSKKGQAELIIAKHRAGPTGSVTLGFVKEKNVFMEFSFREDEVAPPVN